MSKELVISWEEFHSKAHQLGQQLSALRSWTGLVAVTRGGLVPTALVSQEINTKNIQTICIESYAHQEHALKSITHHTPILKDEGDGWLFIDDLSDTGETFKIIHKLFPKAHCACVYSKPEGQKETDTYLQGISQNTWIYFPWELEAQKFAPYL